MNGKKVLLLVGSPRGTASVSQALGDHLLSLLEARGMATKKLILYPALADERKMAELLAAVDACSLLVTAFPLYVDHLPAPLIELLRQVAERRQGRQGGTEQTLTAIVNCGFPETAHCRPAGEIMRIFARQAGFRFLGCLALGMGGAIGNRELAKAGGIVRHQVKALAQAAAYLADSKEIPAAVTMLMGKAMMPRWFYNLAADWGWKRAAKKHGSSGKLRDRPYIGE
ncbi:MAG: NAD(P)H-dependent oxidoreductase [Candidatus Aminicenantes bacterium]|nr:NAD(P)H-dependent oxidoreductase [Candidatus Aminicenantes bacterium]